MTEKKLVIAIKILVYLTLFTPLIVMGNTFIFPFVFPKAIYFRILVEIMLGLYIILGVTNKDYRPKQTPLLVALCYLFFVLFLSAMFGVDFSRSMWGNHERMSGWFTLIHFGAYFVVVTNVFRSWIEWKWFLRASLVVSLIVGFTGLNFLLSEKSIMKIGGGGSLGNFIYLANFLLFHVFIAWFLFRKELARGWKYFALGAGVFEIIVMVYNGKRGPFVGLLAGLFVGLLLYGLFSKIKKWRVLGLSLIAAAIIFSGVIFINRNSQWVQKIPMVGRLATISFSSGTGATRAIAWDIAYKAWKEKPVFGWGVENFYYAFNKYYNPKSLEHGYYETWFDRSHNIFLDYLSTGGILGLAGYLSIFLVIGLGLTGSFRQKKIDLEQLVFLAIFFIGYGLQNFFVFDHLSSYLIFFIMLAYFNGSLYASTAPSDINNLKSSKNKRVSETPLGLPAIVIIFTIFLIYKANILPALANSGSFDAQMLLGGDFAAGMERFKKTVNTYTPHLVDIRSDVARTLLSFAQNPEAARSDVYKQATGVIVDELNKTIKEHPLEINTHMLLGQFYYNSGQFDLAEETFERAQELSPKRQQVAYLWAKTRYMRRNLAGAIEILDKTLTENANIADSYWYKAIILSEMGNNQEAYNNLKTAFEKGKVVDQPGELVFVGDMFRKFGDLSLSARYYEIAVGKIPNNPQLLLTLSEVYAISGNKEKAREMADRASIYDPAALERARAWLK